jgi:beta-phosphoglucomutase
MIKAVIFDMDGVLIDAREWHYTALNRSLSLFGYNISRLDHLTNFDGLPTSRKLDLLTLDNNLPKGLHSFINMMKQRYTEEEIFTECKPIFQHQYALGRLKEHGYKIAVASNSISRTMELMLTKSDLIQFLDFFISAEQVSHPKPDPEIYENAISRLGLNPNQCLVVEDNKNGIQAARAAGAHVMEVRTPDEVDFWRIETRIKEIGGGM